MTRVTDAELERMTEMCASDVTDDRRALLGDAIRAELLALRKVADAAGEWAEQPCEPGPPPRLTDEEQKLIDALREAGR